MTTKSVPAQDGEASSVKLERVSKRYGSVLAVDDLSLSVLPGEFLTMLGPSGCGKTTTLRMIGGFEYPNTGRLLIHGEDMSGRPPYKRPVNTVFQNYALFPHMTVAQNIGYGLEMAGVSKKERETRVGEALELVRLPHIEHRKPTALSGGQQQRVALARALINRPQVLLLDEPLGALDLKLRKAMQIELKELNREVGITFIYVTHDQEEALTMSDRIAVMNAGRILQLGPPDEIYDRPNNRFVADFIGQTNLIDGVVAGTEGGYVIVAANGGATVRVEPPASPPARGDAVAVSVRPEKMAFPEDFDPEHVIGWNRLSGSVRDIIYLGTHTQFLIALPGDTLVTVHHQNRSFNQAPHQIGDPVSILFQPDAASILVD